MHYNTGAGDENVIQVYESRGQATEERVHEALEGHAGMLACERT